MHGETGYDTLEKIEAATHAEIALALDNEFDKRRPPPGGFSLAGLSQDERNEWACWRRSLSVWQKAKMADEGTEGEAFAEHLRQWRAERGK